MPKIKSDSLRKLQKFIPLLCILVCAAVLRFIFFTGMVRGDDLNYAHAAYELSQGRTHFDYWEVGTVRIGLYGSVALLYLIFGPSEATTLAFPILSSLTTVVILFGIGKHLDGEKTGLIAALLWACMPLDIFLASDLLADAPVATMSAASIYFFLLAEGSTDQRKRSYILCVLFLLWAVLIKAIALITLLFLVLCMLLKAWPLLGSQLERLKILPWIKIHRTWLITTSALLVIVMILGYANLQPRPLILNLSRASTDLSRVMITGETNIDLSDQRLEQISLFSLLGPLFLVSIFVLLLEKYRPARFVLLWAGFSFLYYEWGTVGLNALSYRPIINTEERSLLFVLVPFVLLAAIYLGKNLSSRLAASVSMLSSGLVVLAAFTFSPLLLKDPIPSGFLALELFTIGVVMASPFVLRKLGKPSSERAAGILLGVLVLSMLKPAPPYNVASWQFRVDAQSNFRQAAEFLYSSTGLVYMANYSLAIRLNYSSDFALGFDWAEQGNLSSNRRLQVGSPELLDDGEYFVSIIELSESTLREVYRADQGDALVIVYQTRNN